MFNPQEIITEIALDSSISKVAPIIYIPISNYLLPFYVQIESTTKCNLKCKMCRRTNDVNCDIPISLFKSIVDEFKNSRFISRRLDFTGLGEPLFHPKISSMIEYAKKHGFTVSLTSNFTLINREKSLSLINAQLDYLYVSFDGATKNTFEKIRVGANFEETLEKIRLFVNTRRKLKFKKPKLMFETTISEGNVHEIEQIVKLAEALKADGIYFFREVKPERHDYSKDPFASVNWKEINKSGIEILVNRPERASRLCVGMIGCYITFDGKVLPCNRLIQLAPREEYCLYQFGDLSQNSLSEIWFSKNYRQFRKRLALGIYSSFCKSCPTHAY
jgi:radical SAM protein with 4Fe4S-binding SPASM domain